MEWPHTSLGKDKKSVFEGSRTYVNGDHMQNLVDIVYRNDPLVEIGF